MMEHVIQGRVWKFGDAVSTDIISPGIYMSLPMEERKKHSMESLRPEFSSNVKAGDVIVAGIDFGCGSSRESAPASLKALGVSAIVAESFARIFFRSCIALGLPAITCPRVAAGFADGDVIDLDLKDFTIKNATKGKAFQAEALPAEMLKILLRGGIVPMLNEIAKRET